MNSPNFHDIYNSCLAGCIPLADGADPDSLVRMQAQVVLHAKDVHMLHVVHEGFVYYLACNSRALASAPNFSTPLAAALPNHPDHKGDGYYICVSNPYAAAVVRRGTSLKLYVNYYDTVVETCAGEGLPRFDVNESNAVPLQAQSWIYRMLSNRIATMSSAAALWITGASFACIIASSAVSHYYASGKIVDVGESAAQANKLIKSASMAQPLTETLNRIQKLSYTVVSAGGWIEGYQYKAALGDKYVISMPSWVSAESLKALGDTVKTDLQPGENLIWVTKTDKSGASIKGKGTPTIPQIAAPITDITSPKGSTGNK